MFKYNPSYRINYISPHTLYPIHYWMTRTVGVPATKNDPLVSQLPLDIDQQQSFNIRYKIEEMKDIHQIKRIYGEAIDINYPVQQADLLDNLKLIESQFAVRNSAEDLDDESIDQAIYNLIPYCLKQEGLKLPDDNINTNRVAALIFKELRGFSSTTELIQYLENNPKTTQLFGFNTDQIPSTSTFSRVGQEFGIERQTTQNAIKRLRHTLFRNGVLLRTLSDYGYTIGQPIPQDSQLSDRLRYRGLMNWGDVLLQEVTKGVSFNRGSNSKYTVREIIGALALMALYDNFNKGRNLAQLQYKDDIISYSQLHNIIQDMYKEKNFYLTKQSIEMTGEEMNRNLLKFASEELGFFSEPLGIALDSTWISLGKDTDPENVPGAMGHKTGSGYCFATGTSFTTMSKTSLGVNLITDKSKLPNSFRQMLLVLNEFADIGWILADREFDSHEMIELFQQNTQDTWIIRLRDHNNIIGIEQKQKLRKDGKLTISIGGTKVNVFYQEIPESEFNWTPGEEEDIFLLLSGMPLDETTISHLSRIYSNRWSVETNIRELKHSFGVKNPTDSALDYLFILNISSIFYNMYKIINQSLSPVYGLPLRPKYYEVLLGIADSTFSRRHRHPQ